MTNWILNGILMRERFPTLNSLWVESGISWVPFLMQRLDDQYLMRQSEAPLLTKMPGEGFVGGNRTICGRAASTPASRWRRAARWA